MSKHTPGPWTATDFGDAVAIDAPWDDGGRYRVATVAFSSEEFEQQNDANARLISAAPELLEAARIALSAIESHDMLAGTPGRKRPVKDFLRAAIDKAEGK